MGYFRGAVQGVAQHGREKIVGRLQQQPWSDVYASHRLWRMMHFLTGRGTFILILWVDGEKISMLIWRRELQSKNINTRTIKGLIRVPSFTSKPLSKPQQSRCTLRLWRAINRAVILNDPLGRGEIYVDAASSSLMEHRAAELKQGLW